MQKRLTLIVLIALLGIGLILPKNHVKAEKQTITLSPLKIEVRANPGETVSRVLKVKNDSEKQRNYYINVVNFMPQGEERGAQFLTPEEGEESYSLAHWIDITEDPISPAAGEQIEVPFNINVPVDAEPGSHFGLIFVESRPPTKREGATAVAVGSRIGALVFVTVSGETKEGGYIKEFSALKKFYERIPIDFIVRFENTGNLHLKPEGVIKIYSWREKRVAEVAVNERKYRVLPKSIRKFGAIWESQRRFLFGKYTAQLVLDYGNPGQTATAIISFWIIPWKHISGAIIGLIILIGLSIIGIKKYNRWIIRKAPGPSAPSAPLVIDLRKVVRKGTKLKARSP